MKNPRAQDRILHFGRAARCVVRTQQHGFPAVAAGLPDSKTGSLSCLPSLAAKTGSPAGQK